MSTSSTYLVFRETYTSRGRVWWYSSPSTTWGQSYLSWVNFVNIFPL
jgi:hypothetical protein